MLTQNLGYPRIGGQRQLKKASENYWAGKIGQDELNETARKDIRLCCRQVKTNNELDLRLKKRVKRSA